MNTELVARHAAKLAPPGAPAMSFAEILRRNMGVEAWSRLHSHIRARFLPTAGRSTLRFSGVMRRVHCSPIGALLAWLLRPLNILPGARAVDTDFDFSIAAAPRGFGKLRNYRFAGRPTFAFASTFSDAPALHEEFRGGLGMYLELKEEAGALIFRDRGYFVRIGKWRLPLPSSLVVGSFELLHRNLDRERFQVLIRICHPLFGTLFYQRGEFCADPPAQTALSSA